MIVASVLPADFAELGSDLQRLENAGVDRVQWDVRTAGSSRT
jgi:ribulose-phosphate 3-epimerase